MQIRKGILAWLWIGGLCGWLATAGQAAEAPQGENPPVVASEEKPAEEAADAESDEAGAGDSVGGQMGEVSLDRFVPSEEISADGAVSFPVDI